jgi:large conductance mechanosensitive channel
MKGFINFVREQGVVGLAVGFILGGSISKVVSSLVTDVINPIIGLMLGPAGNLSDYSFTVGKAKIMYGNFISVAIDFIVIAFVVYFGVRKLKLDKLDKGKRNLFIKHLFLDTSLLTCKHIVVLSDTLCQ